MIIVCQWGFTPHTAPLYDHRLIRESEIPEKLREEPEKLSVNYMCLYGAVCISFCIRVLVFAHERQTYV